MMLNVNGDSIFFSYTVLVEHWWKTEVICQLTQEPITFRSSASSTAIFLRHPATCNMKDAILSGFLSVDTLMSEVTLSEWIFNQQYLFPCVG